MKTSLKQNDFDRPTLKKGIEQTKSINRRKISRAIFLDRSPAVLRGGADYLSGEVLWTWWPVRLVISDGMTEY